MIKFPKVLLAGPIWPVGCKRALSFVGFVAKLRSRNFLCGARSHHELVSTGNGSSHEFDNERTTYFE